MSSLLLRTLPLRTLHLGTLPLRTLPLRTAASRLAAAAMLAPAAVLAAGVPAAAATSPTPAATAAPAASARVGLYGSQDPAYDGVYRQSLALLALSAGGRTPADVAVQWLLDQQCADGGWTAFRAEPASACDPAAEDTNATAAAVQALAELGESGPATRGTDWLSAQQQADGGVGYSPGGATDANSTALLVSALVAVGVDPATVTTGGRSPYDALRSLQVGCDGAENERGAYDFQPKTATRHANDFATVQATLAAAGKALPVAPATGSDEQPTLTCPGATTALTPAESAAAGAGYLARLLTANKGTVPSTFGSGPDYGSTANAVIALVATGKGASAARLAGTVLAKDGPAWAGTQPAALALLSLSAHALGNDDSALLTRLAATLTPRAAATPSPTATGTPGPGATPTPAATAGSEPTASAPTGSAPTASAPRGSAPTDPASTGVPTGTAAPFPVGGSGTGSGGTGSGSTGADGTGSNGGIGGGSGGRLSSTGAAGLVPLSLGGLLLLVAGALTIRRTRRAEQD